MGKINRITIPTSMAKQNGSTPLKIVLSGMSLLMDLRTNMVIPTGGVISAASMTMTKSKQNQMGSTPRFCEMGKKMGKPISIIGRISTGKPIIKKNNNVAIMKPVPDNPILLIALVKVLETLHQPRNRVNITALIRIRNTEAILFPPSRSACEKFFQLYLFMIKPTKKAANAPTAPPLMGVNIPRYIPPMHTIKINTTGPPALSDFILGHHADFSLAGPALG